MNIKEIRELTPQELDETLYNLRQRLFDLRRRKAVGQLEHGEEVAAVRKDIAKLLTIRRERELQIGR